MSFIRVTTFLSKHLHSNVLFLLPLLYLSQSFTSLLNLAPYSVAQREVFNNDAVLKAIKTSPKLALQKYDFTFASGSVPPLFMAVSLGANEELVAALSDACPAALGETDRYGRTPLHQAVEFGSPLTVVKYLLDRRPESAADADHIGRLPLHCAAAYSASNEIVRLLCEYYPAAAFQRDNRGRLPLHIVCAHEESSVEVVRYLLELNPKGIFQKSIKGSTALELVEKGKAPLEVMLSVSAVALMMRENLTRASVLSLVARLESMEWRRGIHLFVDLNPSVVHFLDLHEQANLVPQFLSSVGRHCKLNTVYNVVRGMPGMLQNAQAGEESNA